MKLGIAFSGSGPGAVCSHAFLDELKGCSIQAEMLSGCSVAAVPMLLWAKGVPCAELDELEGLFSSYQNTTDAIRLLEKLGLFHPESSCKLAVSSVDTATGVTVIHSDWLCSRAKNLKTFPLLGSESSALCAAASPSREDSPYPWRGMRLCDFSFCYGCPFFPLKMAGMERLLSVCFAGSEGPAQLAAESLCALTGKNADLHYTIYAQGADEVRVFVREHIDEIYEKLLF